ncbi:MAG: hypothetical protein Q7R84_02800 [bacterium]|nr:hypothetical protein [bacterium]
MVDIIPKKTEKGIPLKNAYFFITGSLLLSAIFGYVILIRMESATLLKIEDSEASIIKVGVREDRKMEGKVFDFRDRIRDYKDLSAKRNNSVEFFNNFEKLIHPKVWFSSFDFNPAEIQAVVSGKTADFKSMEQQLIFLKKQKDLIKGFDLSKITLGKGGEVDFGLTINFTPKIFDPPTGGQEK